MKTYYRVFAILSLLILAACVDRRSAEQGYGAARI
jgi:hypothetical protein